MPRAPIAVQTITRSGVEPTFSAPQTQAAGGNSFVNNGRTWFEVVADDTAAATTTITVTTALTVDGQALGAKTVTLAKNHSVRIGPFPVGEQTYQQSGGMIYFDCGASVTGLTVAILST